MFAPAGQTTARAGQLCWLAALAVRRQAPGPYRAAAPARLPGGVKTPPYKALVSGSSLTAPGALRQRQLPCRGRAAVKKQPSLSGTAACYHFAPFPAKTT